MLMGIQNRPHLENASEVCVYIIVLVRSGLIKKIQKHLFLGEQTEYLGPYKNEHIDFHRSPTHPMAHQCIYL